jgi:hypothetical protein
MAGLLLGLGLGLLGIALISLALISLVVLVVLVIVVASADSLVVVVVLLVIVGLREWGWVGVGERIERLQEEGRAVTGCKMCVLMFYFGQVTMN